MTQNEKMIWAATYGAAYATGKIGAYKAMKLADDAVVALRNVVEIRAVDDELIMFASEMVMTDEELELEDLRIPYTLTTVFTDEREDNKDNVIEFVKPVPRTDDDE